MHSSAHRPSSSARLLIDAFALLTLASTPTVFLAVLVTGADFAAVRWQRGVADAYTGTLIAALVIQLGWLAWLVTRRVTPNTAATCHRTLLLACLGALGMLALGACVLVVPQDTPTALLIRSVLLGWLAYEICRRHHIPLSVPATGKDRVSRWHTAYKHTKTVVLCIAYSGSATMGAVMLLRWLGPDWLPVMRTDQKTALRAESSIELILVLPWTIVLEGVLIGVVSILLHTAGRPTWQTYTIIAIPEVLFHAYFGLPAVVMTAYAVLCARFYLHHHRIGPLLIGHLVLGLIAITLMELSLTERIVPALATLVASTIAERWFNRAKRRRPAPGSPPPGSTTSPASAATGQVPHALGDD